MNLFQKKDIILHSGEKSDFKIECDALTDKDLECLAYLVSKKMRYSRVVGVPTGGFAFADALRKYRTVEHINNGKRSRIILCDDVLTTGKSMEEMKQKVIVDGNPDEIVVGVVIFSRGKCADWITPIFQMNL